MLFYGCNFNLNIIKSTYINLQQCKKLQKASMSNIFKHCKKLMQHKNKVRVLFKGQMLSKVTKLVLRLQLGDKFYKTLVGITAKTSCMNCSMVQKPKLQMRTSVLKFRIIYSGLTRKQFTISGVQDRMWKWYGVTKY